MSLDPKNINTAKSHVIRKEYERRKALNDQYSLRAFSRDLNVSHTLLSLVISGKRKISSSFSRTLISKLRLSREEENLLKVGLPIDEKRELNHLDLQKAELIADWTYYATMSLLEVDGFIWEAQWVGHRLGIGTQRAQKILNRLLRFELVKQRSDGSYMQAGGPIITENKVSSEACKQYNRNLLKKAADSMTRCSFEERDLSSIVFAVNPELIPYAVERIRNFRRSLSNELENLGDKKAVYALSVQIFPLTIKESLE